MNKNRGKAKPIVWQAVFLIILTVGLFQFCTKEREEHYGIKEETVNSSMWEVIKLEPRFSLFVSYMQKYGLDSIFANNTPMTLFIPANESLEAIPDTGNVIPKLLAYHISPSVFLVRNVTSTKKLLTASGKYVVIQAVKNGHTYDKRLIIAESPLYINGKYFEISEPAIPKPNLYEVTELYSRVLKNYIDLQDSVFLDLKASKPIGFDESGNTVYDSVISSVNLFEKYYFPVKKEFRDKSATFILFTQEQYVAALNEMASRLGGDFNTWEDIPLNWQYEVLLPEMLQKGLFDNKLEYQDFLNDTLKSITGDTVVINHENIDPLSRLEASNGLVYYYSNFTIPLNMYLNTIRIEGEDLVDSIGAERFAWKNEVNVSGAILEPAKLNTPTESIVNVDFGRNYKGQYSVEFAIKDVWPTRYRLVWRANYRPSGIYAVYVNNTKIGQVDTYTFRSSVISVTGARFVATANGFNMKDFWVENITQFGDVTIKFEYLGSGGSPTNGFNIDYVELIPVTD